MIARLLKPALKQYAQIDILDATPCGQGITVTCGNETSTAQLLSLSGGKLGGYPIKVYKMDMVMTSDEICNFIEERVKDEEKVLSLGGVEQDKPSVYASFVAAVEKSCERDKAHATSSNPPKSPSTYRGGNSNPQSPHNRGRNNYKGGGGKGRTFSAPRPNNHPNPPNNFQPYNPPQPSFAMPPPVFQPFPMMPQPQPMQYQANPMPVQPYNPHFPPLPTPAQPQYPAPTNPAQPWGQKGGKGMSLPFGGKGEPMGKGGKGNAAKYKGGKNTPWAGKCGFCYNANRSFDHEHVTCKYNRKNAGQTQPGGRG